MSTFQQFFPGGGSSGGGGGVPATTTVAEVLVVGGGQQGNKRCAVICCPASGGTGGGVLMSSGWNFEQGCVYTVTVGAGGPGGSSTHFQPGSDSSILGYNAPPMGLVGRAAQCYTASACANGATVPTHTVNGNTYHYGTETSFNERFCSPSPGQYRLGHNSAGGAGHPGCGPDMLMALAVGSNSFIVMKNLLYPGGDGMYSDITGTGAYYGPGGHGMYAEISVPCISSNSQGGTTSCMARRPSISCSGCINQVTPMGITQACANYGAGGSAQYLVCGCPQTAGGSGIVFVRYPTEYNAAASVSGNTPTPAQPGYHVYRFNGDGSITF